MFCLGERIVRDPNCHVAELKLQPECELCTVDVGID